MQFGNRKFCFRGSFQFNTVTIHKISPLWNLKFDYLGIFQSLKLRILMEKILSISQKLNFAPNTLDCYGLIQPSTNLTNRPNPSEKSCRTIIPSLVYKEHALMLRQVILQLEAGKSRTRGLRPSGSCSVLIECMTNQTVSLLRNYSHFSAPNLTDY